MLLKPYTQAPYSKMPIGDPGGETVSNAVLSVSGSNAIVDWILVELRSVSNPSQILATRRALIQRDGDIVNASDGSTAVRFNTVTPGYYNVAVKHRNHLGIMSSAPVYLSSCSANAVLDLTTSAPVYTIASIPNTPRKVYSNMYAMWSADANYNKNVKYNGTSTDKDQIAAAVGLGTLNSSIEKVYRAEDVNLDGKIRYNGTDNDRNYIINNVGVTTPNNVIFQHTPN